MPLKEMDAETIAETIINQCNKYGLNLNKLRGQGYDGCSTMAGKENGVQVRISSVYPFLSSSSQSCGQPFECSCECPEYH